MPTPCLCLATVQSGRHVHKPCGPFFLYWFWGGKHDFGALSVGVGGTLDRLTLFDTATYQELLDDNRSQAHNFQRTGKEERGKWVC